MGFLQLQLGTIALLVVLCVQTIGQAAAETATVTHNCSLNLTASKVGHSTSAEQ
jgi:hypothetical protein